MNTNRKKLITRLTLLVTLVTLAGCINIVIKQPSVAPHEQPSVAPQAAVEETAKIDPYATVIIDTTGSSGTLNVPITQFQAGDGGAGCFPTSAGWTKYYVTFYFLGPNVNPLPNPNNYPNPDNLNSVTIDTEAVENGSSLDTGIIIVDNAMPVYKVCNDNASPPYTPNPKLSSARFTPTLTNHKYRAGIYYKAPAPPGMTNIVVHWSYP